MRRILRGAQSRLDYLEIWEFIAAENIVEADKLIELFDAKLVTLAESPDIGRNRAEIAPDLRSLPVGNYVIFYRPIQDGIELLRILHRSRDIQKVF